MVVKGWFLTVEDFAGSLGKRMDFGAPSRYDR